MDNKTPPADPDKKDQPTDRDEAPETPPTEPEPAPVKEPPGKPGDRGPYVV